MKRSVQTSVMLGCVLGLAAVGVAGCGGASGEGGLERIDKRSNYTFQETLDRLTAAVRDVNLVVVKEVDYQTMLKMVNMDTEGLRSYEVFHPRYGAQLFRGDRTAGLEVPLRIFVREDGDKAIVSYYQPTSVFAGYSGLGDLASELDGVFDRMTNQATQ